MSDNELRKLERLAACGDEDAEQRLHLMRVRLEKGEPTSAVWIDTKRLSIVEPPRTYERHCAEWGNG